MERFSVLILDIVLMVIGFVHRHMKKRNLFIGFIVKEILGSHFHLDM